MDLSTAHVLVTGGSSGIGFATARLLSERGAAVAICGRDAARLKRAADELGATGIVADVSHEDEVVRMVHTTIDKLGGYDTLVNNAGFGSWSRLTDIDAADFRRVWETNVLGAMLVTRESARHFIRHDRGNIVNIASTAASKGFAGGTTYVASKFALSGMTECWRSELRPSNIRVMQINPSEVLTNFAAAAGYGRQKTNPTKLTADDIAQVIADMLEVPDRGFITETTVWATNPKD